MLIEKTQEVKSLSEQIKLNFLQIGKILFEIREQNIYKEKFQNFSEYIIESNFDFSPRHAYRLIEVYEQFGSLSNVSIPFSLRTLLSITHVQDTEERKFLIEEAVNIAEKADKNGLEIEKIQKFTEKVQNITLKEDEFGYYSSKEEDRFLSYAKRLLREVEEIKIRKRILQNTYKTLERLKVEDTKRIIEMKKRVYAAIQELIKF